MYGRKQLIKIGQFPRGVLLAKNNRGERKGRRVLLHKMLLPAFSAHSAANQ